MWQVSWSGSFHLQNVADLSDLVTSGRDRKPEEVAFAEECALKSSAFRAERYCSYGFCKCFSHNYIAKLC